MSVHELSPRHVDEVPDFALGALRRWATEKPLQIALRHRRQGVWKAWRWIDVLREVERAAAGLRQQGFAETSRLALSGAYEPSLLILALAAHSLGGISQVISPLARGETLQRQVRLLRADFAFVQRRETVALWREAELQHVGPLQVFSAQASKAGQGGLQAAPLSVLFSGPLEQAQQGWSQVASDPVVWVDEDTRWPLGLQHVLSRWLHSGDGLAFPETLESASRDRQDVAPTALLMSSERARQVADEIEARLAPQGTWRRRLCEWALADPRRGLRRWLKARVRNLLGFRRVSRIDTPSSAPEHLGWLHDGLERAA